ncbi:MAG: hypothetical protein JXR36_09895, partial [Bacteroidales bacterium]|nr:hypothetical protein [Bacteroidales bacterium]
IVRPSSSLNLNSVRGQYHPDKGSASPEYAGDFQSKKRNFKSPLSSKLLKLSSYFRNSIWLCNGYYLITFS